MYLLYLLLIQVQEVKVFRRSCHLCFLESLQDSKQALIQQLPEHHKFACFPKALIFAYFAADLVLSTTWTDQYCSCVRIHGHILKTQWFWTQTKWLLKCDVKISGNILWYMWLTLSMLRLSIATKKIKAVKIVFKQKETYPGAGIPIGTGIRPGKDMGGMWEAPKGTKLTKGPLILFAYKTNQYKYCCRLLFDPALGLHWMLVRNQGLHTVSADIIIFARHDIASSTTR